MVGEGECSTIMGLKRGLRPKQIGRAFMMARFRWVDGDDG